MSDAKQKKAEEKKKCFVITPIDEEGSLVRRSTEGLISSVISPILDEMEFELIASHKIPNPGSITGQVIQNILEDSLAIANLTGLNPNVMYEVAVRHAFGLPLVILAELGTKLPFDMKDERTLFYTNDMLGVEVLKPQLKETIQKALEDTVPDNPIYRVKKSIQMKEVAPSENVPEYILDKLDSIQSQISMVFNQLMVRLEAPTTMPKIRPSLFNVPNIILTMIYSISGKNKDELIKFLNIYFEKNPIFKETTVEERMVNGDKHITLSCILKEMFPHEINHQPLIEFEKALKENGFKVLNKTLYST